MLSNSYPTKTATMPAIKYRAHSFTLALLDGWQDKTIYTLTGPVENGIQHHVIINIDHEVLFGKVVDTQFENL